MVLKKNHDQLDARTALRAKVNVYVSRFARRMLDVGNQLVDESLLQLAREGKEVKDAISIGEAAADKAAIEFLGIGNPEPAIEIRGINALQIEAVSSAPDTIESDN